MYIYINVCTYTLTFYVMDTPRADYLYPPARAFE